MGDGRDRSIALEQQYPWIVGQKPPPNAGDLSYNDPSWSLAEWLGSDQAYRHNLNVADWVGENPANQYEDFAMQWAGQEFDARTKELEYLERETAMRERMMPYYEEQAKGQIANEQARAAWEAQMRGFVDPLTRGEGLPGMFAGLGQQMTGEQAQQEWDLYDPAYREMLTSRGLQQSGGAIDVMNDWKKQTSLADEARTSGEQFNLMNLMQGMPYAGSANYGISPTGQSQLGGALGMGSGINQAELNRQMQAGQWNAGFSSMNDYNADQGRGLNSWLPQVLDIGTMLSGFVPGGGGSIGRLTNSMLGGNANNAFYNQPWMPGFKG